MSKKSETHLIINNSLPFATGFVVLIAVLTTLLAAELVANSVLVFFIALLTGIAAFFLIFQLYLKPLLAQQNALIEQNAKLAAQAQEQVDQLQMLSEISASISAASDLNDVLRISRSEILRLMPATGITISLLSDDGQSLSWLYAFEHGKEIDLSGEPASPIHTGFRGAVIRHKTSLLLNDVTDEVASLYSTAPLEGSAHSASFLGVPLSVMNNIIGVVGLENSERKDAFSESERKLMEMISSSLAISIQNKKLAAEMESSLIHLSQQKTALQTASDVAQAASDITDLQELLNTVVHLIREQFVLYYVGLFLIDPHEEMAVLRAGTGEAGQRQLAKNHKLAVDNNSLIGGATWDGIPRIVQDTQTASTWKPNPLLPETRSELAIPLQLADNVIGALTVQSSEKNYFSPFTVKVMQTMCSQLSIALHNAELVAQLNNQISQQKKMQEISTNLHRTADVNQILELGLRALSEHLQDAPLEIHLEQSE